MTQNSLPLDDYSSFSVQHSTDGQWANDSVADHVPYAVAEARAMQIAAGGTRASRIWGHHRTAKGGFGNRVVWDSRTAA